MGVSFRKTTQPQSLCAHSLQVCCYKSCHRSWVNHSGFKGWPPNQPRWQERNSLWGGQLILCQYTVITSNTFRELLWHPKIIQKGRARGACIFSVFCLFSVLVLHFLEGVFEIESHYVALPARKSLCKTGWPWTHSDLPASALPGLKGYMCLRFVLQTGFMNPKMASKFIM